jgi:hypothetical protein
MSVLREGGSRRLGVPGLGDLDEVHPVAVTWRPARFPPKRALECWSHLVELVHYKWT